LAQEAVFVHAWIDHAETSRFKSLTEMPEYVVSFAGQLLGMGNPLLDISNKVEKETFEKYDKYSRRQADATTGEYIGRRSTCFCSQKMHLGSAEALIML